VDSETSKFHIHHLAYKYPTGARGCETPAYDRTKRERSEHQFKEGIGQGSGYGMRQVLLLSGFEGSERADDLAFAL
jgi:hypothetical protein